MSKRRLSIVLVLAIGALAAVPVMALAARGDKVRIGFELRFTGQTSTAGTFLASGAVDDFGASTVESLSLVPFGRRDRARLSGTQTFTGQKGTVVTRFEGVAYDVSQPHQYGEGRFRVVSGTGAYEDLRGKGRFTIVVDGNPANLRLIGTEEGRVR